MFGKSNKELKVEWIEDLEPQSCTCKGFTELFRKLESLQWKLLNGVDISQLSIKEVV